MIGDDEEEVAEGDVEAEARDGADGAAPERSRVRKENPRAYQKMQAQCAAWRHQYNQQMVGCSFEEALPGKSDHSRALKMIRLPTDAASGGEVERGGRGRGSEKLERRGVWKDGVLRQ